MLKNHGVIDVLIVLAGKLKTVFNAWLLIL